jgi:hypothetical protein
MKRIITAMLVALIVSTVSVQAKILVINGNTTTAFLTSEGPYVKSVFARWQKVLGFEYDVYDAKYLKTCVACSLYTHHGVAERDTLDILDIAEQGGYSMAILLNLPALGTSFDGNTSSYSTADFINNGWGTASSALGQWINRNSVAHHFPIPLFVPAPTSITPTANTFFAVGITGSVEAIARTWTTTHDKSYTDAQGDSIYMGSGPTNITESIVAGNDSLSWVYPLAWRYDAAFDAFGCKPALAWMTVGAGNHKVVYLPYASEYANAFLWPTIIGMFEKITPIDVPILADQFGSASATFWGTSQDTVSLGVNFKAIKDYAVANGMKIDLLGLTWSMKNETGADAHPVFQTTAYTYANQYPGNIRITPLTYEGWGTSNREWLGAANATTYNGVDGMLGRITLAQAGILANFPTISRTRVALYGGYLGQATVGTKTDSMLAALAAKGITDVYNFGDGSYGASYPASLLYQVVGAQRTLIGRGDSAKEIRFHPMSSYWRYMLETNTAGDSTRISYLPYGAHNTGYNWRRADFMKYLVPVTCGYTRTTASQSVGSQGITITSSTYNLATHGAGYQPGMNLPALTFTGGSAAKYPTVTGIDPTRSLFLDVMKMINNQVKMSNYIVDTYGTIDQPVFVYSWMEDCKYDRRLGRTFVNSHVRQE